ncbi:MAG: hypothetical protein JXR88_10910 [Clostridia bacterium]|nr:hypothetical protein [Clostridia bacterium]
MTKFEVLENYFLSRYPFGFDSEDMIQTKKKHGIDKIHDFCKDAFSKEAFIVPEEILESAGKLISKATLVSRFEKPDFKRFIENNGHMDFVKGLYELYYGNQRDGFEKLVQILQPFNLAKWPVITAFLAYYDPMVEVFIKPTTTKKIIQYMAWDTLKYLALPNYEFYQSYKNKINELKENANPVLKVNNPAFCGFMMIAIDSLEIS